MFNSKQIQKDVCWYLAALAITAVYMAVVYCAPTQRWASGVFAFAYLYLAGGLYYAEPEDCMMGSAAFVLSAILTLVHALSKNPADPACFMIMFRFYALGFFFVMAAWSARHAMDWFDAYQERRS